VEHLCVNPGEVVPTASFYNDLATDSIDVELILALEEEFDIEIPDGDAERILGTVADVVVYVDQRLRTTE
jgi:acyl carrier protein